MTNTTENLLNVSELKADIHNDLGEFGDNFCDYSGHHYICDVISEIADNNIDIYYADLFEWCKSNYEYVEEAIAQGLCDLQNPDIPKMIQAGQYEYNSQDLYEHLDSIMLNYCLNYIEHDLNIKEISQEVYGEIEAKCTNVDNNDTLDEFEDFINELLENDEDEEDV